MEQYKSKTPSTSDLNFPFVKALGLPKNCTKAVFTIEGGCLPRLEITVESTSIDESTAIASGLSAMVKNADVQKLKAAKVALVNGSPKGKA